MSTISSIGGDIINISQSAGTIYYNINGGTNTSISSWPVTVNNTNTSLGNVKVYFNDITFTQDTQFFICGNDNIQFGNMSLNSNGTRSTITIDTVTNYPGLIYNNTYNNIIICNLFVSSSNSSLIDFGGWVAQENFAAAAGITNYIINCSSDGSVPIGGGIVGSYSAFGGATLIIRGCSSSGILESGAGGIIGSTSCDGAGSTLIIEQCYSSGAIDNGSGGIIGTLSVKSGALCTIEFCYSLGGIDSISGGICGEDVGDINSTMNVSYCYSQGNILTAGGGIVGRRGTNITATNCYSSGTVPAISIGIFGPGRTNCTQTNCYVANGSWSDSSANLSLTGFGTNWLSLLTNIPYILNNFGSSPYTLNNINPSDYTLVQSYSQTVQAGLSSITTVVAGYTTFRILGGAVSGITIDSSGIILTTTSVPAGTYTLIVYANTVYSTTTFILTVLNYPVPTNMVIPPCCEVNNCITNPQTTDFDANVITNKKQDKLIVSNNNEVYANISSGRRTAYSQPMFKSYAEYMNYLQGKCRY